MKTLSFTLNTVHHFLAFCLLLSPTMIMAQDPHLPPGNLGITNLQDGKAPAPGWYYMQYVQSYQTAENKGAEGNTIPESPEVNSLLAMQQIVHISKKQFAAGNLGFTVIAPLAGLTVTNNSQAGLTTNPSPVGDIVLGPLVQWFNKRLFGMEYYHRFEMDIAIPTGACSSKYSINPGANIFRVFPHYTFTIAPTEKFSFTMRHHLNYFFKEAHTDVRTGMSYNFNYSAEYQIIKNGFIEIAGYYLNQFEQDSRYGDHNYYNGNFGISDTRERVLAVGPGIGYITPTGLFIEVKGMKEYESKNRSEGFRATLVLSYKLDK